MAKKKPKVTQAEQDAIETERTATCTVLLPSVPNFPYQPRSIEPPKGILLILATEFGYVLGEWCGHYFMDSEYRKVEPVYGKVISWCILLAEDGKVIIVDEDY